MVLQHAKTLLAAGLLLALTSVPTATDATASTCLYNQAPPLPTGSTRGIVTANAGANSLSGFVGGSLPCPTGLTSTASPCLGVPFTPALGGDAWCDVLTTPGTAAAPMQCTVLVPPGPIATTGSAPPATLTGLAAGWDVAGPAGAGADGNLDAWDWFSGANAGAAYTTMTFGPSYSVIVYPPVFPSGAPATAIGQLIVYPIVSWPTGFVPTPGTTATFALSIGCL